jgi:hypothetical protein
MGAGLSLRLKPHVKQARCATGCWIAFLIAGWLSNPLLSAQSAPSQRGLIPQSSPTSSALETGPYHALIIGNNNYKYVHSLATPVNDAKAIAQLLHDRYGFQAEVLLDADHDQILTALLQYRRTLPENSNLLIYFRRPRRP